MFRGNLLDNGILDPEGVHHEFVDGMHGRKLDFDLIPTESELFEQWVEVTASRVYDLYAGENLDRMALLSVANGTNRLVPRVAEQLDRATVPLLTEKETARSVKLAPGVEDIIRRVQFDLVLALEDVGTSGTTTASAAIAALEADAKRVEALTTWKRRRQLEKLDDIGVAYNAVIDSELPTYTLDDCRSMGYCALNWQLIEHD